MYNPRVVHVQTESSTCTTRKQYMYNQVAGKLYNQKSVHCTIGEQYMYNQRVVHVQPERSTCTNREEYMYN